MPADRRPSSPRIATFLAVESLSSIGSFATVLVIWGYAAYEYDATAADVALVGLSFSLPSALLGPLAGTVVDRVGAKATLAGAKVLGVVASLLLLGAGDLRTLGLLSFLHGIASAFSMPALQSLPPRIVDEPYVARTNALVSLTDELAITVGPVVGAIAIAAFGFRGAFVVDAVTYAVGLVALPLVRLSPPPLDAEGNPEPKVRMRDAFAGLQLVRRSDALRRLVTCTFLVHMLYGAAILAEPLYVRDVLDRQPTTFAALQTVFGVFLVTGGILAARLGDRLAKFGFVVLGIVASGISAVLYMGTSWIVVSFIGVALWGCATAVISGPSRTLLQRASPVSVHGRVMSTDLMAGSTAELIGLAVAGLCVSLFGVQWTFLGLGTFVILATLRVWGPARATTPSTTVAVCEPLGDSGSTPSSAGASRSASPR